MQKLEKVNLVKAVNVSDLCGFMEGAKVDHTLGLHIDVKLEN